jgi:hypothetical protein
VESEGADRVAVEGRGAGRREERQIGRAGEGRGAERGIVYGGGADRVAVKGRGADRGIV